MSALQTGRPRSKGRGLAGGRAAWGAGAPPPPCSDGPQRAGPGFAHPPLPPVLRAPGGQGPGFAHPTPPPCSKGSRGAGPGFAHSPPPPCSEGSWGAGPGFAHCPPPPCPEGGSTCCAWRRRSTCMLSRLKGQGAQIL